MLATTRPAPLRSHARTCVTSLRLHPRIRPRVRASRAASWGRQKPVKKLDNPSAVSSDPDCRVSSVSPAPGLASPPATIPRSLSAELKDPVGLEPQSIEPPLERIIRLAVDEALGPMLARLEAQIDDAGERLLRIQEVCQSCELRELHLASSRVLALLVLKQALEAQKLSQSSYEYLAEQVDKRPVQRFPTKLPPSASSAEMKDFQLFCSKPRTAKLIAAVQALASEADGFAWRPYLSARPSFHSVILRMTVRRSLRAAGLGTEQARAVAREAETVYLSGVRGQGAFCVKHQV
ncbi:hypothetical protein RTBOTA2_005900 [Rhodotorula toruloides]|nr:hypothetical protein RTBOTA2_005900 [Rhodotorula toruloides]